MDIQSLLCEEIKAELVSLKDAEFGSDLYKATVDSIVKLTDRAIELEKLDIEHEEKVKNRETDTDLKTQQLEEQIKSRELDIELRTKQMEEERQNRLLSNVLVAAGIIVPSLITIWGTLKSFEFEKEGTVTTIMGRGFINKLLPKK